jgi:cytochrome b subunit of formate dehydrogenase
VSTHFLSRRHAGSRAVNLLGGLVLSALLAVPAAAAPTPAPAAAAPVPAGIPDEKCIHCHDDPTLKDDAGHSMQVQAATLSGSAHRKVACSDCHADALTIRHPRENLGKVEITACTSCHQEEIDKVKDGVHAKKGVSAEGCAGCHGSMHSVLKSRDPNNSMTAVNQVRQCGQCHKSMMTGYLSSEHARALFASGLVSAPACTDCHGGGHEIQPHDAPAAATAAAHSPDTCGKCHAGVLKQWTDSAHGGLWQQGKDKGPVCATCHQAHAIKEPTSAEMRQRFPSDCGNCHAKLYESFHDSFHGKAGALGYTAVAMCADCHTPHHNLKASDPRSSVNAANLAATCGKCHKGEVNAAFLTFDPHAKPNDRSRNPYLYWVWIGMTGLLLGVFGFFGLHDLLWLQRSIVGTFRGEFKAARAHAGPYVRRFSSAQMAVHVTIVTSFLVLAGTGLPLKFAAASWAPKLMALWGGAHVAGVLHRIAAVVTFGYFAYHVANMLYQMLVRKQRGFLWGPRSMVPQPSDVKDLVAMVGYFFYRRPRPEFDRWTYWEKFDYLAVFWGVAIIGLTGLVLWFPGAFTRVLPGWALNAAYIAHSDEALLATGFIFLFHFFHTHLRPESFPMDPVVFTGSMPLERFKDERPLEYQRLLASGELDKLMMPAPTQGELLRAYVFGFLAVAIGVALAVGIFVALLGGLLH